MPARRTLRASAGLAGAVLGLAGCGAQPPQSPPTGIDGLVIPMPSPRAGDFVRRVDNRYLPLTAGRRWVYVVGGRPGVATRTVTVLSPARTVDGVVATVVRTEDRDADGRLVAATDDDYAQDRAGNVWWFGHRGAGATWTAGVAGAEAGLVVPAAPRVGDGFATAERSGRPVSVATVVTLRAAAVTPYGAVSGGLRIEVVDPVTDRTTEVVYGAGIGVVETLVVTGGEESARLQQRVG